MNRIVLCAIAAAAVAAIGQLPGRALADPRNEASFTYYDYSFSSPGNAYGPWYVENFTNRDYFHKGSVGFAFENESTQDRLNPHTGQYIVLDNYYDWSPTFFTYAAVGIGTAQPFPSSNLFLEGDFHVLRSAPLIIGLGADVARDFTGVSERYLSIGPTYYWPHFNASLRYHPLIASNGNASAATDLALEYGDEGRALTDLTVEAGGSLLSVQQNGVSTLAPGERNLSFDLEHKQWTSARGGYRVGVTYAHLTDRSTGAQIYTQRGVVIGVFRSFGNDR